MLARKSSILVLLDNPENWRFFRRLSTPFMEMGYHVVYLTFRASLWVQARAKVDSVYLATRTPPDLNAPVGTASDVLGGKLDLAGAQSLYAGCRNALERLADRHMPSLVFIWNGSTTSNLAVADWARENGIRCAFFEVANLPGKIFVDPEGVNAKSRLAASPELLDELPDDISAYQRWRESYLRAKFDNAIVPQAALMKRINWWVLVDRTLSSFLTSPYESVPLLKKILSKLQVRNAAYDCAEITPEKEPFIFFPMQVSSDSQVLANSEIDVEQALIHAAETARERGLRLVVKPHPAEPDVKFMRKILQLKHKYGFLFCNANIFRLMERAETVITINSTAGLEAMILGKDVQCLGRSFYRDFDEKRLRRYVMNYLIDIDYFDDSATVVQEMAQAILNRTYSQLATQ